MLIRLDGSDNEVQAHLIEEEFEAIDTRLHDMSPALEYHVALRKRLLI
jgi:hypothetical protein